MTNFILAGGSDRTTDGYGERLANALRQLRAGERLLSCFFSQAPEDRHSRFLEFQEWFQEILGSQIAVEEAIEETFYDQLHETDILYLHGGETLRLINALPDFEKFKSCVKGKTIIGSSAGANYLSTTFYSPNANKVRQGSGAAGIATVVHYGAPDKMNLEKWAGVSDEVRSVEDGPVFLLAEGEFIVIQQ